TCNHVTGLPCGCPQNISPPGSYVTDRSNRTIPKLDCSQSELSYAVARCHATVFLEIGLQARKEENASTGKSESLIEEKSAPRVCDFFPTPMLRLPARRAASTPAFASSTTMQDCGSVPKREAATRKTCGSGLPAVTSSAETVAWNHRRSSSAS